jgi:hypothetical protein
VLLVLLLLLAVMTPCAVLVYSCPLVGKSQAAAWVPCHAAAGVCKQLHICQALLLLCFCPKRLESGCMRKRGFCCHGQSTTVHFAWHNQHATLMPNMSLNMQWWHDTSKHTPLHACCSLAIFCLAAAAVQLHTTATRTACRC